MINPEWVTPRGSARAEVRATSADEIDTGDPAWDPEDGSVSIQVFIGPAGEPGEESFEVTVCTLRWLAREIEGLGRPFIGRHLLIVGRCSTSHATSNT